MKKSNALKIVFEGVNKVGKTTLVSAVEAELKDQGINVQRIKFPTPDYWETANKGIDHNLTPLTRLFHYQSKSLLDIYQGMDFKPVDRTIYLIDRYTYSTLAYTYAMAHKATHGNVYEIEGMLRSIENEKQKLDIPSPNLTFYLETPPYILKQRVEKKPVPPVAGFDLNFEDLEIIDQGFKRQKDFYNFSLLDGSQDLEKQTMTVCAQIHSYIYLTKELTA